VIPEHVDEERGLAYDFAMLTAESGAKVGIVT